MKKMLCLLGVLLVFTGCSKDNADGDSSILSVSKDGDAVIQEFNKYLEIDGQDIYMETNLKDVYYRPNGKKYSLKEFILNDGEISEITSLLGDEVSYDDGGSLLYSSEEYDLSIVMCHTLSGNEDIYVGDYGMYLMSPMCE